VRADVLDDLVQVGMHHRLAAGNRNDRSAEFGEFIEPLLH